MKLRMEVVSGRSGQFLDTKFLMRFAKKYLQKYNFIDNYVTFYVLVTVHLCIIF